MADPHASSPGSPRLHSLGQDFHDIRSLCLASAATRDVPVNTRTLARVRGRIHHDPRAVISSLIGEVAATPFGVTLLKVLR